MLPYILVICMYGYVSLVLLPRELGQLAGQIHSIKSNFYFSTVFITIFFIRLTRLKNFSKLLKVCKTQWSWWGKRHLNIFLNIFLRHITKKQLERYPHPHPHPPKPLTSTQHNTRHKQILIAPLHPLPSYSWLKTVEKCSSLLGKVTILSICMIL